MRVDVYKNLRTGTWSVRHKGRVIGHDEYVFLMDAEFIVQPAGNARVRREGRKNVHAFVRGDLYIRGGYAYDDLQKPCGDRVTYNPYEHTAFVNVHGQAVARGALVECTPEGVFVEWPETVAVARG